MPARPVVIVCVAALAAAAATATARHPPPALDRQPNEMGWIPILEYHEIGDTEQRWQRDRRRFVADLELLFDRGYRPIGIGELVDRAIDLPRGLSPVIITFDDAVASQFRYVERDGALSIDTTSAVGILLAFARTHPGWRNRAVFCVPADPDIPDAMFGQRAINGQRTTWGEAKLRHLVALGFELCGHTDRHVNLATIDSAAIPRHIARGILAIDSAVPGYRVRSFALPYGAWPADSVAARAGHWLDPAIGRTVSYRFDAIFEAWGGPVRSPFDPAFNPQRLTRTQGTADLIERTLDGLEASGRRYVSDGDPARIARPR